MVIFPLLRSIGYLNNDVFYTKGIFIDKIGYRDATKLKKKNDIIGLINGISTIPYKVNREVLEFINQYGVDKGIIIDIQESEGFRANPHVKLTRKEKSMYRSLMSRIFLQTAILAIAQTYSKVKAFYFPIHLDQRTRFYCDPFYFHYQSTDLAKGLISFANPGFIYKTDRVAIDHLKSYGAETFDGKMGRKPFNVRAAWVDDHKDEIINFQFNDVINSAEDKTCFLLLLL